MTSKSSKYARSLIEASLDPLVTISVEGKITDLNEASAKVTGETRDKLIGTDFSNYFIEPKKAREGYKRVFEKEFVSDYPLTVHHKNGILTDVLYNASVYKDEKGNVLVMFAAVRFVLRNFHILVAAKCHHQCRKTDQHGQKSHDKNTQHSFFGEEKCDLCNFYIK